VQFRHPRAERGHQQPGAILRRGAAHQKTYLKPDIGCFVLFDGGFSGLVIINLSAASAMELYRNYLLNMGLSERPGHQLHLGRSQQRDGRADEPGGG
jgi:hypothetical protein